MHTRVVDIAGGNLSGIAAAAFIFLHVHESVTLTNSALINQTRQERGIGYPIINVII